MTLAELHVHVERADVEAMVTRARHVLAPQQMREFLRVGAGRHVTERIEQRFQREGDDVVGRWAPLRWSTQNIRAMTGYPPEHPINVRTGDLKRWLTAPGRTKVSRTEAWITFPGPDGDTKLEEKLETAQRGRKAPRTVKRPVLGLNTRDMTEIMSRLQVWFATEMARGGHS